MVTLSISRPNLPAQSLGGAHRGGVCVFAFIGVSVCAYMRAPMLYFVSQQKTHTHELVDTLCV